EGKPEPDDILAQPLDGIDPCHESAHYARDRAPERAHFDLEVAARARATKERLAFLSHASREHGRLIRPMIDIAPQDRTDADAAAAIAAFERQREAGLQARIEQRLIGASGELVRPRMNLELE